LTVIDWEFNRQWENTQAGPALCDLLYFVTYWHNVANHLYTVEAELQGMGALFLEPDSRNPYTSAIHRAIADYMAALAIDRRFLPLLLVYVWLERAIYSAGRAQKLATHAGASRSASKFVTYVRYLAEHTDRLFAEAPPGAN
jgi:hypothetical protein